MVASLYPRPIPVAEALALTEISEVADRPTGRLSGGLAQRVRFAANPDLLLLDEPTAALDVEGRHEFWASMRAVAASGKTVIFATHYLEEADADADRIVLLARGRIVAERATGWTRQLRITPLRAVAYFRAKVLCGYLAALLIIVVLGPAGLALGVRLSASQWLTVLGLLGGAYGFQLATSGTLQQILKGLPSYWLRAGQADRARRGRLARGGPDRDRGLEAVLVSLTVLVFRRDTGRA